MFNHFLTPKRMSKLIALISKNELLEDPQDFVMSYLVYFSHTFSMSMQHFTSFYLLSHGTIKIFMLILLWRKVALNCQLPIVLCQLKKLVTIFLL
ncbi:DUF2127 domain-containing protein [Clostridium liquoris]|uniref:DUF2127 domain-containing protein n=1 Tax=Clostridium liquoris TaxID=1289519 RepID=UPI003BFA6F81